MSVTFIREPVMPVDRPIQRVVLDITPLQAQIIRGLLGGMQSGCKASRVCHEIYKDLTKEFGMLGFNASDPGYVVDIPREV